MADVTSSDMTADSPRWSAHLADVFAWIGTAYLRYLKRKRLYMELMWMDERRLADLGLGRADIDEFVRRQTFGLAGTNSRGGASRSGRDSVLGARLEV